MTKPIRRKDGTFRRGSSGNPSGLSKSAGNPSGATSRIEVVDESLDDVPLRAGAVAAGTMPTARHLDGWASALTGIGRFGQDKRMDHHYEVPPLEYMEAMNLWRGDDIAARAIESVPSECFRQGYEITIGDEGSFDDLKEQVETRLQELGADEAIELAMRYERAYGGGAILLGVRDSRRLDQPLEPERVRGIDWLTVLEPIELMPWSYYTDPEAPKYGYPEFYRLNTVAMQGALGDSASLRKTSDHVGEVIHESRLVLFGGIRVSRYHRVQQMVSPLWGDSILIRLVSVLRDFNIAWNSAGIIASDFAQSVITIENLKAIAARDPKKLHDRMAAIEIGRSTARAILLDTNEKYQRQSTTLTGFPDLLNGLSTRLAAAVDMPVTLLMGQSPKGLGNEGDSDVRFYYDRIKGVQTRRVGPIIRFLAGMIMKTLRQRKLPKKWGIRFNPLWQLTDGEKAEARLTQARADSMYIKMGAVTCDEIRRSRFVGEYSFETQVDENKRAPGIPYPPGPAGTAPAPGSPTYPGGPDGTAGGPPIAPPPPAVKPGATGEESRPQATNPIPPAPPAAPGAAAHAVAPYVRKAPATPHGGQAAAAQGGDSAPKKENRDGDGPGELVQFAGLPIVVESPKGSVRTWTDTDGTVGSTKMRYDYGYVRGTMGSDGDSIDVYLGPSPDAQWVYVIHQNAKSANFEGYDEDKAMLGFDSANHARDAYLRQYDDERFYGGMSVMPLADFAAKVSSRLGKITHDALTPAPEGPPAAPDPLGMCDKCGDLIDPELTGTLHQCVAEE